MTKFRSTSTITFPVRILISCRQQDISIEEAAIKEMMPEFEGLSAVCGRNGHFCLFLRFHRSVNDF